MASWSVVNIDLLPDGTKTFAEPVPTLVMTMHIQNTNVPLMKQQLGLGLYSVTTWTGDILWRFTKTTLSGNKLHYSHYKQYTYAITKNAKNEVSCIG